MQGPDLSFTLLDCARHDQTAFAKSKIGEENMLSYWKD